ncbi:MAG: nucleotidyltransferase domain-containing protein [Mariprofundus sp.]
MISQEKINSAAKLLISSGNAVKVILFGSYARGDAGEQSDIDFLVVEKEVPSKVKAMVRLRRVLRPLQLPIDVMVVSERDVEEWGGLPGTALYWALKEGKMLQDATV